MTDTNHTLLSISNLETGYGKKPVLCGVSLAVSPGEIVAVIGPNGSGKSTTLKAVHGLLPTWKGEIHFDGTRTNGATPAQNVSRGITFCPQGSRVFSDLTVTENLQIGGFLLPSREQKARIEETLVMFPILRERAKQYAGKLSGGEQQMVAIARALIPRPRLLMLDEPSLGLSPKLVGMVFDKITEISRETGTSILIVEQKVREVLEIASRVYSLKLGRVAFSGPSSDLKGNRDKLKSLFL